MTLEAPLRGIRWAFVGIAVACHPSTEDVDAVPVDLPDSWRVIAVNDPFCAEYIEAATLTRGEGTELILQLGELEVASASCTVDATRALRCDAMNGELVNYLTPTGQFDEAWDTLVLELQMEYDDLFLLADCTVVLAP